MNARRTPLTFIVALGLLVAAAAAAQETAVAEGTGTASTIVKVRLVSEARSDRSNPDALAAASDEPHSWNTADFGLASFDGSWARGRVRLGGDVAVFGDTETANVKVRVREGYARVSATDWLDVEGGKRILKWGTGYAFTPTGVLDPPRDPTDPRDRLGTTEGVVYGGVHLFRGDTALSIVGASPDTWRGSPVGTPHRVIAFRLRTLLSGVEVAAIASRSDTAGSSFGGNFTHVIGRSLEWHGEVLVHRRVPAALPPVPGDIGREDRQVSALVGCQYTFNVGLNVVLEYYHDGNGLDRDTWERLGSVTSLRRTAGALQAPGVSLAGAAPVALPGLRHFAFLRAAPAAQEPTLLPELLTIVGLDDGSLTLVPGLTWTAQVHVQLYARGTILAGRSGSVARAAASKGGLQVGVAARF
jgi:hypothetical protein